MSDSFIYICGSCFINIRENQGVVLNCGDFLCNRCSSACINCPLCSKENVAKLSLNSSDKPPDVAVRMSSTTLLMENLYSAIEFQSKSYTRIIRKLVTERATLIKKTKALEDRVQELQSYQIEQDGYRPSSAGSIASNCSTSPTLWRSDTNSNRTPSFLSQSNQSSQAINAWQRPIQRMLLTNGPSGTDSNHNLDNDFGSEYRGRDPQQGQQSSNWPPGTRSGDTNSVLTTQTGGGGGGTKRLRSPAAQYVIPPNKVVSVSQQQFQQKQYHQPPSESHVGSTYSDRINGMSNNNTGGNSQAQFRPTATRQPPPALLRAPSPSAGWLQSRPATPNPRS